MELAPNRSSTSWTFTCGFSCGLQCMRCIHAFLKQTQLYLCNSYLVWDPILASQTQAMLFLHQTLHQMCSAEHEHYLYLYLKLFSLPLCFQGTITCDYCASVSAWAFGEWLDAGRLWWRDFPGGTRGLTGHCPLPITPRLVHLQNAF